MTLSLETLNDSVVVLFAELQKRNVVLSGTDDPRGEGGIHAPIGSTYVQTFESGQQKTKWEKFGASPTDWGELLSVGGGGVIAPIVVSANDTAELSWTEKTIHITAEATCVITFPEEGMYDGFTCGFLCEADPETIDITFVREDENPIKTKLGDVMSVGFANQNGFIAVTYRDGEWFMFGELVDAT